MDGSSDSPAAIETTSQCNDAEVGQCRGAGALFLYSAMSALIPGSGQMAKGQAAKAAMFFAVFACSVSGVFLLGRSFPGLAAAVLAMMAISLASAWDAMRAPIPTRTRPAAWSIVLAVAFAMALGFVAANSTVRLAGLRPFQVPSTSMQPTILRGESIVVDYHAYRRSEPRRGDVIVFRREGTFFLKRVIAVAGDQIAGVDGNLILNGTRIDEPYAQLADHYDPTFDFPPVTIPARKLFVVGDERQYSLDSRVKGYGLVDVRDVLGRAIYIVRSKTDERVGKEIR